MVDNLHQIIKKEINFMQDKEHRLGASSHINSTIFSLWNLKECKMKNLDFLKFYFMLPISLIVQEYNIEAKLAESEVQNPLQAH